MSEAKSTQEFQLFRRKFPLIKGERTPRHLQELAARSLYRYVYRLGEEDYRPLVYFSLAGGALADRGCT